MNQPHFDQPTLAALPKDRRVISYFVGMSTDFMNVVLKFRLWSGKTETYIVSSMQAKHLVRSLKDYYARMPTLGINIEDARTSKDTALIDRFNSKCPELIGDDWNGRNSDGSSKQTVALQVDAYRDAIFVILQMHPATKNDWRVVRLDPRLGHWLLELIGEHEARLVDVGSMPTPSQQIN